MSNEIQMFENSEFGEIGVLEIDGKVFFPATRAAQILGYSNPYDAISRFCKSPQKIEIGCDLGKHEGTSKARKTQEVNYIPEGDLYRLITRSKLPSSQRFESWIFDEVLPTIRKHGAYMTKDTLEKALLDPHYLKQLAERLIEEQERADRAEAMVEEQKKEIAELAPKANYCDVVLDAENVVSITQIAKDFGKSASWLNEVLRQHKIQYLVGGTWVLYAQYANKGYTATKTHPYGRNRDQAHIHTYWTQKGRKFIYELLESLRFSPITGRFEDD